jgi:hypothetical protein
MRMHAGEELFSARMVYDAWVAPTFEATGCVAPRFCGLGTDRSPLIIDAARDVPQLVGSEVTTLGGATARLTHLGRPVSSDGPIGCWVAPRTRERRRPSRLDLHLELRGHGQPLPQLNKLSRLHPPR